MPRAKDNRLDQNLDTPIRKNMADHVPLNTGRSKGGSMPKMMTVGNMDDNNVIPKEGMRTIAARQDGLEESSPAFQKDLGRVPAVQPDIDYNAK